ncbi:hypothetical protein DIPPA_16573 [Diplonema papillatum]|nr:hypothetical protein DIPPA_16573 [Diplonema papillatum]
MKPVTCGHRKRELDAPFSDPEAGDRPEPIKPVNSREWTVWQMLSASALAMTVLFVFAHMVQGERNGNIVRAPVFTKIVDTRPPATPAPKKFILPGSDVGVRFPDSFELAPKDIKILSWNVAPLSQNPFALWLHDAAENPHETLVKKANEVLSAATINELFTDEQFARLQDRLSRGSQVTTCLPRAWDSTKGKRWADFMRDAEEKGIMLDLEGQTNPLLQSRDRFYRPSPGTCFGLGLEGEPLHELNATGWWGFWTTYMFKTDVVRSGSSGNIAGLFSRPAITAEDCYGTDILALAIYDAGLVHALSMAEQITGTSWETARKERCSSLFFEQGAEARLIALEKRVTDEDVVFIHGATRKLLMKLKQRELRGVGILANFTSKAPAGFRPGSTNNVLILIRNKRFFGPADVTDRVFALGTHETTTPGSVFALAVTRPDSPNTKDASNILLVAAYPETASHASALLRRTEEYLVRRAVRGRVLEDVPVGPLQKVLIGCSIVEPHLANKGFLNLESSVFEGTKLNFLKTGPTAVFSRTLLQQLPSRAVALDKKAADVAEERVDFIVFSPFDYAEAVDATFAGDKNHPMPTLAVPTYRAPLGGLVQPVKQTMEMKSDLATFVEEVKLRLVPKTPLPTVAPIVVQQPSSESEQISPELQVSVPKDVIYEEDLTTRVSENGSIILPHPNVGVYVGVPHGALVPPSSLTDQTNITVSVVCDNGLGDRLGSLYSAVRLAYSLRARFHLIWNMNNECQARASVLFEFDGTSSSVANVSATDNLETRMAGKKHFWDAIITLKHHFSTGHFIDNDVGSPDPPRGDAQWLCGDARKVHAGPTDPLVRWAQDRQRRGLRTNILYHTDRLAKGVELRDVRRALQYYNFRINPAIIRRVDIFTQRHSINPKNTVGVHLRGTDARVPLDLEEVVTDVRLRFNTRTFFVSSDDNKAELTFLRNFAGRAVSNTMKTHFPGKLNSSLEFRVEGKLGAGRFNVLRNEYSVVDSLTDMAILSRTERPIIVGALRDSSFGKMSTTLCVLRLSCDEELALLAERAPAPARPGNS